jgi:hypothetical protein
LEVFLARLGFAGAEKKNGGGVEKMNGKAVV